jgi:hypothetical protein
MRRKKIYIGKQTVAVFMILIVWATIAFSAEPLQPPQNLGTGSGETFDSARFQSAIRSGKSLGSLAKENSVFGEQASSYGFAAKSEEAKFFIIGSLYSEALAYLKSGNADLAAKRLEAVESEFINLQVPSSLYNYISKTRNILETKRYTAEGQAEFLSLFQPFFEDYARTKGEDKLTLFRAGSWLTDMSLAAAGGDTALLRQQGKLNYFIKEMKRMDAPKGVIDALGEIVKVAGKKEITDKDAADVLKQVKKIQTALG